MLRCLLYKLVLFLPFTGVLIPNNVLAQSQVPQQGISGKADLNTCIAYALVHQPLVQKLQIRDDISRRDMGIALSEWFPQVDVAVGFQQYLRQPVSIFPDFNNPSGPKREITTGVKNTSSVQLSASQFLFNPDVIFAGRSAGYYRRQSSQTIRKRTIDLVVQLSKAFYDVLLTEARQGLLVEDLSRIDKSMKDAQSQYESGISDKIDYQRAMISMNNIRAEMTGTASEIKAKRAYLKELMGYPADVPITVFCDSLQMIQDSWVDTTRELRVRNRIEYQLLLTNLNLQRSTVGYYRNRFLPSLSAYANYNLIYQNDDFGTLYDRDFPNSSVGLRLSMPLFQGTKRIQQLKRANLLYTEMALDTLVLKNSINTAYEEALASYKSNLKALDAARENARIASEIYSTVRLQYNQGIKSYLEVIVSEADLRASRINALNALYRLLSSKLDVETALGNISVNY